MKVSAQKLKTRHLAALSNLKKVADEKFRKTHSQTVTCAIIGSELNVTGQTVINYVNGNVKKGDGFLIEALTEEFKKL